MFASRIALTTRQLKNKPILAKDLAIYGKPSHVTTDILVRMSTVSQLTKSGVRDELHASSGRDEVTAWPTRSGNLNRIVATWHAAINFLVPIGYENETGFHYGELPNPSLAF